jgi:anti-anti-sigma regulatory factor
MTYVEELLGPAEELFLLDSKGRFVERSPAGYDLSEDTTRALAQVTRPFFHKQDFSAVRVLAVPFVRGRVLCVAYESSVGASPTAQRMVRVLVFLSLGALIYALAVGLVSGVNFSRTMRDLAGRMEALAAKDIDLQHEAIAQTSLDEVGDLVQAFNHVQRRADQRTTMLRDSVSDLEVANEQRRLLLETMIGLTAPVIRVTEGLVIVPLAGYFDVERASHIRPNLLAGIVRQHAQIVVMDLTGVVEVTETLVDQLACAARSAALMGCQVILTGIGADLAWALMQMESGLGSLTTHRDLEDGLEYAYARLATN